MPVARGPGRLAMHRRLAGRDASACPLCSERSHTRAYPRPPHRHCPIRSSPQGRRPLDRERAGRRRPPPLQRLHQQPAPPHRAGAWQATATDQERPPTWVDLQGAQRGGQASRRGWLSSAPPRRGTALSSAAWGARRSAWCQRPAGGRSNQLERSDTELANETLSAFLGWDLRDF